MNLKKRENLSDRFKNEGDKRNGLQNFPNPVPFMKDVKSRILNEAKSTNTSIPPSHPASPSSSTPRKNKPTDISVPPKNPPRSLTPYPLPPDLQGCSLVGKKDATSAISRAKTQECKDLIRNITCLQEGGKLYDTDILNMCPFGRDPGKGFQKLPYSLGSGPNARVVFLMSIHGRAHRQVKRLFKAVYHTDHYFFIHVDSVR